MLDDLHGVKDDMTAFIEGHGLKRFHGYVSEEISTVNWEPGDNLDSWKDFVELAKAAGASFLTMSDVVLEKEELDFLIERLRNGGYPSDEDQEEARMLRIYSGKTGFIQLGWPCQGVVFLYEISTEWYDRYQRLVDYADDIGGFAIDESEEE